MRNLDGYFEPNTAREERIAAMFNNGGYYSGSIFPTRPRRTCFVMITTGIKKPGLRSAQYREIVHLPDKERKQRSNDSPEGEIGS